jgi:type IX secretion system PorP/SprF family membrane protein
MYNNFVINPAFAGTYDYVPVTLSVRRQWVGINEAPVTQTISSHGYVGMNMGLGGYFFNETAGPTRRTGISFSAAYSFQVSRSRKEKDMLSIGLAPTVFQYAVDQSKLVTAEPDDIAVLTGVNNRLVPDANFGLVYMSGEDFYAGISSFNLLENGRDLFDLSKRSKNKIERTHYIMSGYNMELNNEYRFQPSTVIRGIEAGSIQFDINAKIIWQKYLSFAISYRHQDAAVAFFGIQNDLIRFIYSYDYTLSDIKDHSSGSHEISLTAFLLRSNRLKGKRRYTRFVVF